MLLNCDANEKQAMIEDLQTDSELWDTERQTYMLGKVHTRLARSLTRNDL